MQSCFAKSIAGRRSQYLQKVTLTGQTTWVLGSRQTDDSARKGNTVSDYGVYVEFKYFASSLSATRKLSVVFWVFVCKLPETLAASGIESKFEKEQATTAFLKTGDCCIFKSL